MSRIFKLVANSDNDSKEIHIWEWSGSPESVKLNDLRSAAIELFSFPLETKISFTWFDGLDTITCSSDTELTYILKRHLISLPASSTERALRLGVHVTPTIANSVDLDPKYSLSLLQDYNEFNLHTLHLGVKCDECQGIVYGIRYKCLFCPDFDICSVCFANNKHLIHPFGAVRHEPGQKELMHTAFNRCQPIVRSNDCTQTTPRVCKLVADTDKLSDTNMPNMRDNSDWEVLSDASDFVMENGDGELGERDSDSKNAKVCHDGVVHSPSTVGTTEYAFSDARNQSLESRTESCLSNTVMFMAVENSQLFSGLSMQPVTYKNNEILNSPLKSNCTEGSMKTTPEQGNNVESREYYQLPTSTTSQQKVDMRSKIREIFHEPAEYIADAWSQISSALSSATTKSELQVLLDAGYSNDDGILSFLLGENHGSSNAVLDLLRQQSI